MSSCNDQQSIEVAVPDEVAPIATHNNVLGNEQCPAVATKVDDLLTFDDDQSVPVAVEDHQQSLKSTDDAPIEDVCEKVKALVINLPINEEKPLLQPLPMDSASKTNLTANFSSASLVEVPLHESSDEEFADIEDAGMGAELEADDEEVDEGEHADHLSPLMMDNHTIVEHLECFQQSSPTSSSRHSPICEMPPVLVVDSAGNITIMKHSDTKESLSSVDSDMCMSFDRGGQRTSSMDDSQGNSSSSDDPARDSGCETGPCLPSRPYCPVEVDEGVVANGDDDEHDDDRPFEIPDEEFSERIVEQVEFYFSNESILKDAFLLKHVRRNKEGFVSLKLVSSFKRVRQLTKDWRVVGHAIQLKSKQIELNDVGTKVRRLEPLPNYDETMPSRTVVATDLTIEKITIEKVYEMFSSFGEIALVRILRVGGPIPADVRQFINKYPELLQKECALVEFIESKSARNALAYEGITVLEMIAPKKKTGKKAPIITRIMDHHQSQTQQQPSMMMYGNSSSGGMDQERSRGGAPLDNSTPPRFQIRRTASGYYSKPDQVMYVPPPRKFGYSNGHSGFAYNHAAAAQNQGYSAPNPYQYQAPTLNHHHQHQNQSQQPPQMMGPQPHSHHHHHHQQQQQPHYQVVQQQQQQTPCPSSSPDNYEVYRRTSNGHIVAVTSSPPNKYNIERRYCEPAQPIPEMRRGSLPVNEMGPRKMHSQQPIAVPSPQPIYECQCSCQQSQQALPSRRLSMSSVSSSNGNELIYRRAAPPLTATASLESPRKLLPINTIAERKTSVTETNWRNEAQPPERKYSNTSDQIVSTTVQYHPHHHHYQQQQPESPIRKYSNGFDPLRKLSNTDEYVNGRRISTDSGYDRKYSFSSDCSAANRSRSNSIICNHAPVVEQIVRTPVGPASDGSRGFGQRTRKIGQILPPI